MSKDEIKYEINKVLDNLPDKSLEDLLTFLKSIESKDSSLFNHESLQKILLEDKELLQKLAR